MLLSRAKGYTQTWLGDAQETPGSIFVSSPLRAVRPQDLVSCYIIFLISAVTRSQFCRVICTYR